MNTYAIRNLTVARLQAATVSVRAALYAGTEDLQLLAQLAALAELRDQLEILTGETARAAQGAGASWAEIGGRLGRTKQAAQQRYAVKNKRYDCSCGWTIVWPPFDAEGAADDIADHRLMHEDEDELAADAVERDEFGTVALELPAGPEPMTQPDQLAMLDALDPSDLTRKFYTLALELDLTPSVEFKAETSHLMITVQGPAPSRGWLMLSQLPGAGAAPRHSFRRAGMAAMPGKTVTRYEAFKQLRDYDRRP